MDKLGNNCYTTIRRLLAPPLSRFPKQPSSSRSFVATSRQPPRSILSRYKLGHADLSFGSRSEFISRSVHAELHVSTCSGYDLCHPG